MSARLRNSAVRCVGLAQRLSTSSTRASSPRLHAVSLAQAPSQWQKRGVFQGNTYKTPATTQARPIPSTSTPSPAVVNSEVKAAKSAQEAPLADLTKGLSDEPLPTADASPSTVADPTAHVDWTRSYHGLSAQPFSEKAAEILLAPIDPEDVEIKPDGILYLPEIKYRRILNQAFRPGGWGLAPRGETIVTAKAVTREYGLVVLGRLVSVARGEQDYFSPEGIPTAAEGCRSNALLRCCKDLGIASELWDPRFIREFMANNVKEVWAEHQTTKKRKKLFVSKKETVKYPWKEVKA